MSYPEGECVVLGCRREVMRTADGVVWNRCWKHVADLVTGAFFDSPQGRGRRGAPPSPSTSSALLRGAASVPLPAREAG